ncbi:MAG: hypothetical protein HN849_22520, partial [Victivallales bacterium]|nr:hypothetical protein [Victivallales bacterium]
MNRLGMTHCKLPPCSRVLVWFALVALSLHTAIAHAGDRFSYYCNGEIHVGELGPEKGKVLTKGHSDFKPSWSKT